MVRLREREGGKLRKWKGKGKVKGEEGHRLKKKRGKGKKKRR